MMYLSRGCIVSVLHFEITHEERHALYFIIKQAAYVEFQWYLLDVKGLSFSQW
jgi:hypothetical protein